MTDLERFQKLQLDLLAWYSGKNPDNTPFSLMTAIRFYQMKIEKATIRSMPGAIIIKIKTLRGDLLELAILAYRLATLLAANRIIFSETLALAKELYQAKNRDYGDSYKSHGSAGVIVRLTDKICRARQIFEAGEQQVKSESLKDTLIDLGNYCLLAVMLIDQGK
jgi:hypothetical protein